MQILDFYTKFVSATEKSHLFQALRNLSQAEDLKSALDGDAGLSEWTPWPPMEAAAACTSPAV